MVPALLALTACLSLGACSEPGPLDGGWDAVGVDIQPARISLAALGDTARFVASAWDAGWTVVTGAEVAWSLDDPSVATIDQEGLVTAVGNGRTRVVASADGVWDSAWVEVEQAVGAVHIDPGSAELVAIGDSVMLRGVVVDSGGGAIVDASYAWSVLDTAVAALQAGSADAAWVVAKKAGATRVLVTARRGGTEASDTADIVVNPPTPPGLVLVIGDGMGFASLEAARLYASVDRLAMELPFSGTVGTGSASSSITDSGAAATAMATGVKTFNRAIGVGPDGQPLQTVLELAETMGMATGLVATSSIAHATPAAFAAHVSDRGEYYAIAEQMAASGVDVLLGGGRQYFKPGSRPDGRDLTLELAGRGCQYHEDASTVPVPESLKDVPCLVGLFAADGLPAMPDRGPLLGAMAEAALSVLSADPDGFFLMVEGSQIDWAQHANDGPRAVRETLDLDGTVERVLSRLGDRPNTVVIVVADHETGGLSVTVDPVTGALSYHWTTTGHTSVDVPLFAQGDEANWFTGRMENDELGRLIRGWISREWR